MRFSRQGRRRAQADFQGGRLVSDAGLLALREMDRRCGLTAALAEAIGDPREPAKIQHEQSTMLARMCGVEVDDYTFNRAFKQFDRFAGRGNAAYGDTGAVPPTA